MARFRNPRYAPESLERRLSPANLIPTGYVQTSLVATLDTTTTDPTPPPDGDGSPPLEIPTLPSPGPAVPV